jgi:hypothetical protein
VCAKLLDGCTAPCKQKCRKACKQARLLPCFAEPRAQAAERLLDVEVVQVDRVRVAHAGAVVCLEGRRCRAFVGFSHSLVRSLSRKQELSGAVAAASQPLLQCCGAAWEMRNIELGSRCTLPCMDSCLASAPWRRL